MPPKFTVSVWKPFELPLQKSVPRAKGLPFGFTGTRVELYELPTSCQVAPSSAEISSTAPS